MTINYPDTPATDFAERLHGREVADPYRWLENTGDQAVQDWIDAQNAVTQQWLSAVPERDALAGRLRQLWDFPRRGVPTRHGKRWFQARNTGLQDQDVLWVADGPDDEGRVLLDPNTLSDDGTTALAESAYTADGSLLAYAVSEQGSDWRVWRVRDVASGEDLPDLVRWSKFIPAVWHPDGSGFWYGAYDPPSAEGAYQAVTRGQRLAFHRLGTPQSEDEVVCSIPDDPEWLFIPQVSDDGRWLAVMVSRGSATENRLWVADLAGDGHVRPLLDDLDARYLFAGSDGDLLYVLTDRDAPRGRLVALDGSGDGALTEIVAERDEALRDTRIVGGRIFTLWLSDAASRLRRHRLDGTPDGEVELPGLGSVEELSGHSDDEALRLSFVSLTAPPALYRHDVAAAETTCVWSPSFPGDPAELVTEQVFATSADGTRVPMFVVHRADARPDRSRPTLLWGYGGFNIPVPPAFHVPWYVWVERGGVLALANLRGGGEYGRQWHDAGRLHAKQNVFDDAVACAERLIADGWTDRDRLAIKGRSNGGLLAGACLVQRPDLFGAAVVEVGVLDMLRFHHSTIGWAWKSDFGDPDDPGDFENLLAYSPYHNVRPGTAYPPTLVTTGDHDDRVVPSHSFKFAAALQAAQAGPAPVLLRVDRSGGHGMGKPTGKVIDERADVLAFLTRTLGE